MTFRLHIAKAMSKTDTYRLGIWDESKRSEGLRLGQLNRKGAEHSGKFQPFSPFDLDPNTYASKVTAKHAWSVAVAKLKISGAQFNLGFPTMFTFPAGQKPVL